MIAESWATAESRSSFTTTYVANLRPSSSSSFPESDTAPRVLLGVAARAKRAACTATDGASTRMQVASG